MSKYDINIPIHIREINDNLPPTMVTLIARFVRLGSDNPRCEKCGSIARFVIFTSNLEGKAILHVTCEDDLLRTVQGTLREAKDYHYHKSKEEPHKYEARRSTK